MVHVSFRLLGLSLIDTIKFKNFQRKVFGTFNQLIHGKIDCIFIEFNIKREKKKYSFNHINYVFVSPRKEGNKTLSTDLKWKRDRIYDKEIASALYLSAVDDENGEYNPKGVVVKKNESDTKKLKPLPLSTVDLTKQGEILFVFEMIIS